MNIKGFAAAALCAAALVACGAEVPQASAAGSGYKVGDRLARPAVPAPPASDDYREISWDDLMPADWDPMALLDKLDMGTLQDSDPQATKALAEIRKVRCGTGGAGADEPADLDPRLWYRSSAAPGSKATAGMTHFLGGPGLRIGDASRSPDLSTKLLNLNEF
ncbi:MAG: hypothetical protein H6951_03035 [Zoogloeaceae bacterium]|nr:hypothetical protein [Zoogloeaceae bacterium]